MCTSIAQTKIKPFHKPGPLQLARLQKPKMANQEDLQEKIDLAIVVGKAVGNRATVVTKKSVDTGALKFDQDKLPLHLLSTEAMNQTAAVLRFGAVKYAEHNWRKGFAWSRPLAAAMRHITAFNAGEDKDPESGLSHISHAMCCLMFISEFEKTHKHLDDRYKPEQNV